MLINKAPTTKRINSIKIKLLDLSLSIFQRQIMLILSFMSYHYFRNIEYYKNSQITKFICSFNFKICHFFDVQNEGVMYHIHENLIYSELSDGTLGLGNISAPDTDKNALTKGFAPKHLTIPYLVNNKKVTIILERALKYALGVRSIDLPHTLKEIKKYGICDMQDLRSLVIPASVEELGKWSI